MKKSTRTDSSARAFEKARLERAQLMQRLLEILRPHAPCDPHIPDICTELALYVDGTSPELALEFAQLAHDACLHQPGTSKSRIRRARELVIDCRRILADRG